MKKLIALFLMVSMLFTMLVACGTTNNGDNEPSKEDEKNPTSDTGEEEPGITVTDKLMLGINQVLDLDVKFVPEKGGDSTLTFTSSDTAIVTCDGAKLTGVAEGDATVTISNADGKYTATVEVKVSEVLKNKTALFVGDSITAAAADNWQGWARRVEALYGVKSTNAGRDGTSISDCRKGGSGRVLDLLNANKNNKYNFVILHGGVNDAWDAIEVGTITQSYNVEDFDVSTFAGGLEELFYYAKEYFPNAKIGYIINFKMVSTIGNLKKMDPYFQTAKLICKKWGIPYLDMFFNEEINDAIQYKTTKYLHDLIHPNTEGYVVLTPYVGEFMRQLQYGLNVMDQQ
ncbi:MAG: hypothetical protein E7616_03255 [Ruminococcaceae bacterium]|nr:hypothetical protein [Oscillospiraceae bacterium]